MWIIRATEAMPVNSGHDIKCGHSEPGNEFTTMNAKSIYPFM
jgi:hypothetical protein